MDYKKINELFKDLNSFYHKNTIVHQEQTASRDGYESSYDERFVVYDAKLGDGHFIKISYKSDSYGDNEEIVGIEFVKGKEKKITVYEF